MTKYRIQLDLTDDELGVLYKALNEALARARFDFFDEASNLNRIIEELGDAGDIAETLE